MYRLNMGLHVSGDMHLSAAEGTNIVPILLLDAGEGYDRACVKVSEQIERDI